MWPWREEDILLGVKYLIYVSFVRSSLLSAVCPLGCEGRWPSNLTKCVVDAPLTQTNRWVVVSGVRETHSNANAAYKYISNSSYFKPSCRSEQFKATRSPIESSWSQGNYSCTALMDHWFVVLYTNRTFLVYRSKQKYKLSVSYSVNYCTCATVFQVLHFACSYKICWHDTEVLLLVAEVLLLPTTLFWEGRALLCGF